MNAEVKQIRSANVPNAQQKFNRLTFSLEHINILNGVGGLRIAKECVREFAAAFEELTELDFYRELFDTDVDVGRAGQMLLPRYLRVPEDEKLRHTLELQIQAQCAWFERVELGVGPSGYYWAVVSNDHNEAASLIYRRPVLLDTFYFMNADTLREFVESDLIQEGAFHDSLEKVSSTWRKQLQTRLKIREEKLELFTADFVIVELSGADTGMYEITVDLPYETLKEGETALPLFKAWVVKFLKDLNKSYPGRQYDYATLKMF